MYNFVEDRKFKQAFKETAILKLNMFTKISMCYKISLTDHCMF